MITPSRGFGARETSVPWREVLSFTGIAVGLCSLVSVAFWLDGSAWMLGLSPSAWAMFTPAVAALVVLLWNGRSSAIPRATAMTPVRPYGRIAGYCVVAVVLPIVLGFAATSIAVLIGLAEFDLTGFSGLRGRLGLPPGEGFPAAGAFWSWLLTQFLWMVSALVVMFGEEWGWRGYLLPKLLPLGVWPALLLSGMIWALWHAPLMVGADPAVLAVFLIALPVQAVLFGWLRLAACSIWPVVLLHTANNSVSTLAHNMLTSADVELAPAVYAGSTGGAIGLVVVACCVVTLAGAGQIRVRPQDPAVSVD